ncbi:MAG: MlaE family ABC transporter permease [Pseudomonadota bacterium]
MIETLGKWTIAQWMRMGDPFLLLSRSFWRLLGSIWGRSLRRNEILKQIYECAVLSIPVIAFSLSIVSLMSVLEFSWHMKIVLKQDALVPGFAMVLTIREVAPVVAAMLLAARVGASIAAEIGVMKNTEQLDQLKLLAVSEIDYLLIPRWVGCVVATSSLTLVSLLIAGWVTCFLGSKWMGYQPGEFFNSLFIFTKGYDLMGCMIKSLCFGTLIPFVSASYGLRCAQGSQGVGEAATQAVAKSTLLIIILDLLINSIWWMP